MTTLLGSRKMYSTKVGYSSRCIRRKALYIRFKADAPFMIKIYCGKLNVVSGELDSDSESL